jgi:hypothetical protein
VKGFKKETGPSARDDFLAGLMEQTPMLRELTGCWENRRVVSGKEAVLVCDLSPVGRGRKCHPNYTQG